jgi:hypothetical protein
MVKIYYIIIGLVLAWMGTSLFWFFVTSQVISFGQVKQECVFVVGRNGTNCYVKGHHRKDLDIVQEFTTLMECEEYLSNYIVEDDY